MLKIDKKSHKDIGIYNIGYITKKKSDDCQNIYSVNPLYLFIDHASGYVEEKDLNPLYLNIDHTSGYIKEKGVNNYLVFDFTDENKELLKKHSDAWNGIKIKIKEVGDSMCDYGKDYMKIRFNSDDNLPLNKPLKFHLHIYIYILVYIKMSQITDLTHYQRNRDLILNKPKDYYKITKRN